MSSDAAAVEPRRWAAFAKSIAVTLGWVVAAAALLSWVGSKRPPERLPAQPIVSISTGQTFTLTELSGQPTLLYFWATWCGACGIAEPVVADFSRRHPNVRVVAVATESVGVVRRAIDAKPPPYEVALADKSILSVLGVTAFPTCIAIDSQGRPMWMRSGVPVPGELDLQSGL
ncbi:MAG TPA: hypothetical protein DCQ06_14240 [Myxococcales bacterium]|nr:hypothetical protein [Myxococcales bacterium]HAN32749.1 hypothetical protein [Myxococcales bacterium]